MLGAARFVQAQRASALKTPRLASTRLVEVIGTFAAPATAAYPGPLGDPHHRTAAPQTGATQRLVVPAALADESSRRLTLDELFAFPEPDQRLARLAHLREDPGGGGDCGGKQEDDVPRPDHRDAALDE